MGVKVNESGTIKNLALDTDEVETLRAKIIMPAVKISAYGHYLKAADLGITKCYATTGTSTTGTSSKSCPSAFWSDIPDDCKVLLNQGTFNFKITLPCKFKTFSSSIYNSIDNILKFPNPDYSGYGINSQVLGWSTANRSAYYDWAWTAHIHFALIIDNDGEHWRSEAALVRSSAKISESSALADNYCYNIASVSSNTFPYTLYFNNLGTGSDYLIEKVPYKEIRYTGNSIVV